MSPRLVTVPAAGLTWRPCPFWCTGRHEPDGEHTSTTMMLPLTRVPVVVGDRVMPETLTVNLAQASHQVRPVVELSIGLGSFDLTPVEALRVAERLVAAVRTATT